MSAPLTPEQLRAIRERVERATPGPWHVSKSGAGLSDVDTSDNDTVAEYVIAKDAAFIAAARTDVVLLLDEVERVTDDRDQLEQLFKERGEALDYQLGEVARLRAALAELGPRTVKIACPRFVSVGDECGRCLACAAVATHNAKVRAALEVKP